MPSIKHTIVAWQSLIAARLFPSRGKTKFGEWVNAGALKAGDRVSTSGSIAANPHRLTPANDNVAANAAPSAVTGNPAEADQTGSFTFAANDNHPLTVSDIVLNDTLTRVYNLEIESRPGEITHNYLVGEAGAWVHNYSFGDLRRAYNKACALIGGCKGLPKFKGRLMRDGTYGGGPGRGTAQCGIRLDQTDTRRGPHFNWWDWRGGKRGAGGRGGHIDLE